MNIKFFTPSLKFWIFPALASLIFTLYFFSTFVLAQVTPVFLNPKAVYQGCLNNAAASNTPPEDCRTNLPREAEYNDCTDQASVQPSPDPAIAVCQTTYVNNVITDHLNRCISTYRSLTANCQTYYSASASFASCVNTYKNPVECERAYGYKPPDLLARDTIIPSNVIPGIDPFKSSVGSLITNGLQIAMIAGGLLVLTFLIIGAFKWIASGGDKDSIGKARGTIISALVGLTILALAFFITVLFSSILGINVLNFKMIPTLNQLPSPAP